MEIKDHFTHIGETIQLELNSAQASITAAIAWLTDPELFNALVKAARRGVLARIAKTAKPMKRSKKKWKLTAY